MTAPAERSLRSRAPGSARLASALWLATLALVVWAPLPQGSHPVWATLMLCAAALALFALGALMRAIPAQWPTHLEPACWVPMALWLAWLGWCAMQIVPLPSDLVAIVSPLRYAQVRDAALALGDPLPSRMALSVDAAATRRALLLSASLFGIFLLVCMSLRRARHARWLLWVLVFGGLGQALYGSVMTLSGLEFGAWGAKDAYRGYATGTFVNRNHFAGYLELCLAATFGLIVALPMPRSERRGWRQQLRWALRRLQDPRLFLRVCVGILFLALLLSQSRLGNVAAVAGLGVAAAALLFARRGQGPAGVGLWLVVSVLVLDVWLFGRWFGLDQLADRYAAAGGDAASRFDLLKSLLPMLPSFGLTGSGLGSFAVAFPPFRPPGIPGFVDHAHNDYLQFVIETGWFGAALLGSMALATALRAFLLLRRRRDPQVQGVAVAGLAGLVSLGIHSLSDFNLQIPAVALTLVALMAAVWASPLASSRSRRALDASSPA